MQTIISWIDAVLDDRRLRKLGRFDPHYVELALRNMNNSEPRFFLPVRSAEFSSAHRWITNYQDMPKAPRSRLGGL